MKDTLEDAVQDNLTDRIRTIMADQQPRTRSQLKDLLADVDPDQISCALHSLLGKGEVEREAQKAPPQKPGEMAQYRYSATAALSRPGERRYQQQISANRVGRERKAAETGEALGPPRRSRPARGPRGLGTSGAVPSAAPAKAGQATAPAPVEMPAPTERPRLRLEDALENGAPAPISSSLLSLMYGAMGDAVITRVLELGKREKIADPLLATLAAALAPLTVALEGRGLAR
jgi:hypothetical protein